MDYTVHVARSQTQLSDFHLVIMFLQKKPVCKYWLNASNVMYESENEVAQLCLTLCDPVDYSLPGYSDRGILQAKNIGVGCQKKGEGEIKFPSVQNYWSNLFSQSSLRMQIL